jgi:mannitol/fructose-specific phosphotransferase system IIA component (Ntr-type)
VIEKLVGLLVRSGKVANEKKLLTDLWNREKKANTAVGHGVAIPHVRTMQARDMAMAVGVSHAGIPWGAPDGEPVKIWIAMVAPPYEDRLYLQIYQRIGRLFESEGAGEAILGARSPGEIIRYLARMGD